MNAPAHAQLLATLQKRFAANTRRHANIDWATVQSQLESMPDKLRIISEMERTGGEPDVVGQDAQTGELLIVDCSAESPTGRRSLCYDGEALAARKENKPAGSAKEMAAAMGVALLTEQQYYDLQALGRFDLKTSSWLETPPAVRALGGAIFGDCRYDRVFVYHNGVQSYYAARGFRGLVRV